MLALIITLLMADAQVSSLVCSKTLRCYYWWRRSSVRFQRKNVKGWTIVKHSFEKCEVMLRKPRASFIAAKSEHIDQI